MYASFRPFKSSGLLLMSLLVFLFSVSGVARAAVDYTGLTGAVDFSSAIAAILLVMGGLAGVYVVITGGSLILQKLKGGGR